MQNAISTQTTNLINVIDIVINGVPMKGCNARDLHAFLENGDEFAHWIKDRVCQYDFQENQDFSCVWENTQTQRKDGQKGISKRKNYHITLGMAKELAMVERNDQGKQARKYFIECERKLLESQGQIVPHNYIETITAGEQQILQEIVEAKTKGYGELVGKARAEVWSRVHHKFRISKYEQLPRTQITDCILYINQMELKLKHPIDLITSEQYHELVKSADRIMVGWVWNDSDREKILNNIRIKMNIQSLQHLPASEFVRAMQIIHDTKQITDQCLNAMCEIKEDMIKQVIMGGAPYTPSLTREYKKQFGELPNPINWVEMQQRLLAA